MHKTRNRFVIVPLAVALGFSGCEYMGPSVRKTQLPANLAIEHEKGSETRPVQSEPLAATPTRPAEYYPATGTLLGPGAPPEKASRKEGKFTLNFDDADLSEVAKTILDETLKINYVLSPKVTGKVTLQTTRPLSEDELIPTLEMLLRMNGAVLIKDRDLYRIEPDATALVDAPGAKLSLAGQALPPGYQLRVVPLRYVGVQEMQKVLEPMMPPKAVVRVDPARNILMLAGSADELESVLETIRLFDVDFMRGMTVGVFPLKNTEPAIVAEELDKVLGDTAKGPLAGLVRLLPIERLNAILVVTPQPRYLDEVETWIERLDRYTTTRAGGIHVYRVQNVDAIELANTLSNIFGGGPGATRGRPSLSPGQQGAQIGGAYGAGGAFGGTGGTGGAFGGTGGTSGGFGGTGDMGTGSSFGTGGSGLGSTGSSMGGGVTSGGQQTSGTGGLGGGATGGGLGGSRGGMGMAGGFGGGIGRGSTGQRGRTGGVAELGNVRIVADPANNALIITARAQDYKEIEAVIKELDVLPLQVLIDATIAEVKLSDALRYGIRWFFEHGSNAEGLFGVPGTSGLDNITKAFGENNPYLFHYSLVMAGKNVRVLLSALSTDNKVNVLSSPSLMVLNNQEATIKVGDQVPILTGQYGNFTGSGGSTITGNPVYSSFNSIQYRDTGVLLTVRPRVNAGGLVIMDLEQAVDDVAAQTSGNIDSPTITQRQIRSSVAVNNGDTLVLGGLIKENTANNRSGIPLLHDLPIIGSLFGKTDKTLDRTELVVLLTPRVVESRTKARDITNEFRRKLTGLYEEAPKKP